MRVHIIGDIEGVAGIVKWAQTGGDQTLYHEGRSLYTEEINAAVRGAKKAGAKEIVVMDCHGAGGDYTFNSLLPDRLEDGCEFVVQNEWTEYTAFLEEGCDAALLVGMHAKAGTPDGVLVAHGVEPGVARPALQRGLGRRDRHQRGAVRELELPGASRDRRSRDLHGGTGVARRRPHDRRGEGRLRALQHALEDAEGGMRAHRGRARSVR